MLLWFHAQRCQKQLDVDDDDDVVGDDDDYVDDDDDDVVDDDDGTDIYILYYIDIHYILFKNYQHPCLSGVYLQVDVPVSMGKLWKS
jgi:hypothetical protein